MMRKPTPSAIDRAYDVHGPPGATTIVLLHGMWLNRHLWGPQIRALSPEFRVVAADLPGHGALAEGFVRALVIELLTKVVEGGLPATPRPAEDLNASVSLGIRTLRFQNPLCVLCTIAACLVMATAAGRANFAIIRAARSGSASKGEGTRVGRSTTMGFVIAGVVAVLLLAYLVYTLFRPNRFE